MSEHKRVLIDYQPFGEHMASQAIWERPRWPGRWIQPADQSLPMFAAFRCAFTVDAERRMRVHVSADERYELFLDGLRIGRGPERGDANLWFFESYDLDLTPGRHVLVARVWALGEAAPYAQISVRPGFLLCAEGKGADSITTGIASWQTKRLTGYEPAPLPSGADRLTGCRLIMHADALDRDVELGIGDGWQEASPAESPAIRHPTDLHPIRLMAPAMLGPMLDSPVDGLRVRHAEWLESDRDDLRPVQPDRHDPSLAAEWQRMLEGSGTVQAPAKSLVRVIVDLDGYYCAYSRLVVGGGAGACIKIQWAEALFERGNLDQLAKGNRDQTAGLVFEGIGNTFLPDGRDDAAFEPLWWEAGRYLQIIVSTAAQPLSLRALELRETRYALPVDSSFECSDACVAAAVPLLRRSLEMCSHETFMDCPRYEQLQYVGDTRLEALVAYTLSSDDKLPLKSLRMFHSSRLPDGMVQSRYPSRVRQVIPPFSLWWVAMLHDRAMWRGDLDVIRGMMPAARDVVDAFLAARNADGLVESLPGWNFIDWVPHWDAGMGPASDSRINGVINWHVVYTLNLLAELEAMLDEPELEARARRLRAHQADACRSAFWSHSRGCFADDVRLKHFSQHAQCLALLSGVLDGQERVGIEAALTKDADLAQTTIYFSHYLFEALTELGRIDALQDRLELWLGLKEQGFKTTPESPEPSRSDCHAWGSHPLYHFFASVLGIRPARPAFGSVVIRPQLGSWDWARGRMIHPKGVIIADFHICDGRLNCSVELPGELSGRLEHHSKVIILRPGRQELVLDLHESS